MSLARRMSLLVALVLVAGALFALPAAAYAASGTIYGAVTGDTGGPIGGCTVSVYAYDTDLADWVVADAVATAPDGTYALALLPGTYRVGYSGVDVFRAMFFENALTVGGGQDIVLNDADWYDASQELPSACVRGTIRDDMAAPIEGATVTLWKRFTYDITFWGTFLTATTDVNGEYAFVGLDAGTYRIEADATGKAGRAYAVGNDVYNRGTDIPIALYEAVTGIDLVLPDPGFVTARVLGDDGLPLESMSVYATRRISGVSYTEDLVVTDANGEVTLAVPPDSTYRIRFTPTYLTPDYIQEWYNNAFTVGTSSYVTVTEGSVTDLGDVPMERYGNINAFVTCGGAGVENATVELWALGSDGVTWAKSTQTLTNSSGWYGFPLLRPGTYKINVIGGGSYTNAWYGGDSISTATEIALASYEQRNDTNVEVLTSEVIGGTVFNQWSIPFPDISLQLYKFDGVAGWDCVNVTASGGDGTYGFGVCPPGIYQIVAVGAVGVNAESWYGGSWAPETAANIEVGSGSTMSEDMWVTYDPSPPDLYWDAIPPGWTTEQVDFAMWASDADSAIESMHFRWNNTDVQDYTMYDPMSVTDEGTTTLKVWAHDWAGNESVREDLVIRIDKSAPVTGSDARALYIGNARIALAPVDENSGVAATYYAFDGGSTRTGTSAFVGTAGDHYLEFWSEDNVGKVEGKNRVDFHIDQGTRTEETDALFGWTGPWMVGTGGAYSGGTLKAASGPATFVAGFDGTGVTLVSLLGPNYGVANVSIDGGPPTEVNLYAASYTYKRRVFNAGPLAAGPHTIKVWYSGLPNGANSSTSINVDAVEVLGTLTQAPGVVRRYEETDSKLEFAGSWTAASGGGYSGGALTSGRRTGAKFRAAFIGTEVSWIGLKGPGYGQASVSIDGGPPETVDLYNATFTQQAVLWTSPTLASGPHTVDVTWTGVKTWPSTGDYINLDALDVVGTLTQAEPYPTRFEQTDPRITFGATWSTASNASYSNGSLVTGKGKGTAFKATFDGTSVDWVGLKGPGYGKASVILDGGAPITVDLWDSAYLPQQALWSSGPLAVGSHTLEVQWAKAKNPAATSNYINLDALDIQGTLTQAPMFPTRWEQDTPGIDYTGPAWTTSTNSGYSGGSVAIGRGTGTKVEVDFFGSSIKWIALTGKGYGRALVTLDSGAPVMVDLYSTDYLKQQEVWGEPSLPLGSHTLTIEWTGTKTAGATSDYINLDALDTDGFIIFP